MVNLSPEICRQLKKARVAAGLSQSLLAAEVGCKQSALSMFEQGDGTKLNDEVIQRLCTKFAIDLTAKAPEEKPVAPAPLPVVRIEPHTAFCPNALCPSHHAYVVDGRRFLRPDRTLQDPVGAKFCAVCGEILERRCPNCGAAVHEGAVCSHCGEAYVAVVD